MKKNTIRTALVISCAGDTCSRNKSSCFINFHMCRSILYKFLSGTSFLHTIEHSSISLPKLSSTWHKLCNVRVVLVQEAAMIFPQIFCASFSHKFLSVCCRHYTAGTVWRGCKSVEVCWWFDQLINVDNGEECSPGDQGEVCVRGPQLMQGYLNNPTATAATVDSDGWLHTGLYHLQLQCVIGLLIDWLTDGLIDWPTDWLIDWLCSHP